MSDVLVIGAGAAGCLSALSLVRRGARVTLIERGMLGMESSWAGGGILFPLLPWHYGEAVNRLALAGAACYPALADELRTTTGIDPEYTVSGMLVHPDFDTQAAQQWCAGHGVLAEMHAEMLWLPQVAQARNPRLMQALRARLESLGVCIVENSELVPLQADGARIAAWSDSSGRRHEADAFVLTAGAWSRGLLGEHALELRIKPMRGQMLLYRLAPGALEHILYCEDFYLIPRRDGHILAGSTVEDAGFDKSATPGAAADLQRKAIRLLPALADAAIVKHWSGLRPGSPDNIPTIARHPSFDNLYLNAGHFRYGVTMAPASATMLVDLMEGRPPALASDYAFPA
jgi:glycine oxidase